MRVDIQSAMDRADIQRLITYGARVRGAHTALDVRILRNTIQRMQDRQPDVLASMVPRVVSRELLMNVEEHGE